MKTTIIFLLLFLCGCAGSPRFDITKNVYLLNSPNAKVEYRTESAVKSLAEIAQDLEGTLKVTPR